MAADQGAGFVLINPLHAVAPTAEQEASPYLPATRRFRNPIYLRVAEVPGADGVDLEEDAGRALSDGELIDRDAVWARKREVLLRIFFAHGGGEAFAPLARGAGADRCRTGPPGRRSPRSTAPTGTPGRRSCAGPGSPEVAAYVEQHGADVAFHAWLQWALELQFTAATEGMTVIQDLPIGVAGGGADAWAWQDVAGRGRQRRRAAGRVQLPGPGLGLPAAGPVAAAGRRLRAVHPVDPRHDRRRRRACGSTTSWACSGSGGCRRDGTRRRRRLRPLPGRGPARHRRAGEPPRAGARRRRGPRHGRGRRPRGHGRARRALLPAAVVRGRRPGRVAGRGDGRDHHPRPAHGRRAVDRRGPRGAAGARHGTDEELERGRASLLGAPAGAGGRAPTGDGRSSGRTGCSPRRRRCCCRPRWTTPSASCAGPTCPATTDRPNWSLPLPVPVEDLPEHPLLQRSPRTLADGVAGRPPRLTAPDAVRRTACSTACDTAPVAGGMTPGRGGRSLGERAAASGVRPRLRSRARGATPAAAAGRRRRGPALLGARPAGGARHLAGPARRVAAARRHLAGPGRLHGDRPARPALVETWLPAARLEPR